MKTREGRLVLNTDGGQVERKTKERMVKVRDKYEREGVRGEGSVAPLTESQSSPSSGCSDSEHASCLQNVGNDTPSGAFGFRTG